jgi:glycosyltransferase involved in cell wall biosynthesis
MLEVSVVVPTRDRPQMLSTCLASIAASLGPGDELIVVDSASSSPEVEPVAVAAGATYVRVDEPGASRARNVGWRTAHHELVAFVDDDVRVAPSWADGIRAVFRAHPEVAFLTGRIGIPPEQGLVERPVALKEEEEPAILTRLTAGVLGHSANLVVRREALARVNGFDELMGAGARFRAAEDNDLFDRLLDQDFAGRYEPAVQAWHDQWRTRMMLVRLDWAYGIGTGARIRKLWSTDRLRARSVVRTHVWEYARSRLPSAIRRRYEFEVATVLARLGGTAVGVVASMRTRVAAGHLSPRRGGSRL